MVEKKEEQDEVAPGVDPKMGLRKKILEFLKKFKGDARGYARTRELLWDPTMFTIWGMFTIL